MAAVSSRGAKNQVRIRGPKPDVSLQCSSLDNLEKLLQSQVEQGLQSSDPDVVYSQFIFDSTVSLQVDSLPDEWRDTLGSPDGPSPIAVPDAVAQLGDAKTKLKRQRAVARSILKSIQNVDGFNYFEKEAWDTKHLDGYRFKFLCRDSFQNKDRAQNRARSSNASNIESAQAPSAEQSPTSKESRDFGRLPTYDCKGSIFVKFSASQRMVDVVYQHMPVHREPIPERKRSRDSDEDAMEIDNSIEISSLALNDSMYSNQAYETPGSVPPAPGPAKEEKAPRAKRRKKSTLKAMREAEDFGDESSMYGVDTPERRPAFYRRDNSASPPRDLDWPMHPDDKDFARPSVVTRVPSLSAQLRDAVRQSYRTSSDDTGPYAHEPKKERKKPGPKPRGKAKKEALAAVAAATAAASTVGTDDVDTDKPARRRTKTGCWTCRTRKLKCNENRPKCSQCARSRPPRECSYPDESDAPAGFQSGDE